MWIDRLSLRYPAHRSWWTRIVLDGAGVILIWRLAGYTSDRVAILGQYSRSYFALLVELCWDWPRYPW